MALASSVMSMPTGHQVMQRPQPTQPLQHVRHRADGADRVHQPAPVGLAADADRHLADARQVEHVELAGRVRQWRTVVGRLQLPGEDVAQLAAHAGDAERARQHGRGQVEGGGVHGQRFFSGVP